MVITINRDNVSSYKDYFQEAFNYLKELEKELGPILKNEDIVLGTITSLDSYYSYIEYLKDNDHFFLGLSSPASAIKVNANSRTIDTTTVNLSNFTVVQKDNGAELLTFVIDRYFDAIDLFNADIYVQWTAPDADGRPTRNYASRTRKDLVVVDNKSMIKIGWIIDDSVTEFAGDLQFSLAFLINDPETDDFVRLNTLPASIRIEKALQPEINSGATIVCPYDKVRGAILNNRHYGQGEIVPLQPWFDAPGQNLPSEVDLDPITNSLTLKAQALSDDLGVITYIWQHKPYEATRWFVCDPDVAKRTFTISATEELNGIDYKYLTEESQEKLICLNSTAEKEKDKKYTLNTGLDSDTLTSIEFGEIGWSYEKTTDLKKMPNETYWRIEKNTYDCHYAAGSDVSDAFEDIVGYWAPVSSIPSTDVFTISDSNYIAKKNFSIKGDSLKETRVLKGNSISADEFARIKFYLITLDSTDTDELTETKENFADDFLDGNITKVNREVKKLVPTVFGSEEKTIYRGGSISQTDYDAITHISTDVLGGFVAVTNELKERYFVRNNNVYVVQGTPTLSYRIPSEEKLYKKAYYTVENKGINNAFIRYPDTFTSNTNVYEKYTTLTLPADTEQNPIHVIGEYNVIATNTVMNKAISTYSTSCEINGPDSINFVKNLSSDEVLTISEDFVPGTESIISNQKWNAIIDSAHKNLFQSKDENSKVFNGTERVSIKFNYKVLEVDILNSGSKQFNWEKAIVENQYSDLETETNTLEAIGPGWYRVKITSQKNRETKDSYSNVCKLVAEPENVTFADPIIKIKDTLDQYNPVTNTIRGEGEDVNSVTIYTDVDQSLEFTVVPTLPESDLDTKLRTDGYEYEWRYVAGGNTGNINNTTVLGREATYRLTTKDTTGLVKCIVKNKLGDKVSETPFVFLLV